MYLRRTTLIFLKVIELVLVLLLMITIERILRILNVLLVLLHSRILKKQGTVVALSAGIFCLFVEVEIVSANTKLLVDILVVVQIAIVLVNSSHSTTRAILV